MGELNPKAANPGAAGKIFFYIVNRMALVQVL